MKNCTKCKNFNSSVGVAGMCGMCEHEEYNIGISNPSNPICREKYWELSETSAYMDFIDALPTRHRDGIRNPE